MATYNESRCTRLAFYGLSVDRDDDILPQDSTCPLFNVVGGRIAITQIIGEVTDAIEDQANDTKLTATPTGETAVDLCAALDIADHAVGTLYGITGTTTDAMKGSPILTKQAAQVIVGVGTVDLVCAAENTGSVKWTIYYIALDDGAYVTAANPYTTTTSGA